MNPPLNRSVVTLFRQAEYDNGIVLVLVVDLELDAPLKRVLDLEMPVI